MLQSLPDPPSPPHAQYNRCNDHDTQYQPLTGFHPVQLQSLKQKGIDQGIQIPGLLQVIE